VASNSYKVRLLHSEACAGAWRIVELSSNQSLPFRAYLEWAAGAGTGHKAQITVPGGTRICVFARHLQVEVSNLCDVAHTAVVTAADGFGNSQNQWEETSTGEGATAISFFTPPFAQRVRLECADQAQLASCRIRVYDPTLTLRSEHTGLSQPDLGVPVGGARRVDVLVPNLLAFRLIYTLSI